MRQRWVIIALWFLCGPALAEQRSPAVDLELVIAVDVSYSMDVEEQRLQREGYVSAFRNPEVIHAIGGGRLGRIAVTYVEWGGSAVQVVPWTILDGPASATRFADALERQPIKRLSFTSISNALAFARGLIRDNHLRGTRRVIDVSGDGPNNAGAPVPIARDAAVGEGITVDGLPIMLRTAPDSASIADLDAYYEACVVGGEGAFLMKVSQVDQLGDTIRKKLVVEISGFKLSEAVERRPAPVAAQYKPANCLVGEETQERSIGK